MHPLKGWTWQGYSRLIAGVAMLDLLKLGVLDYPPELVTPAGIAYLAALFGPPVAAPKSKPEES